MKLSEQLHKSEDVLLTSLLTAGLIVIGFIIVFSQNIGVKSSAALWSLACLVSGALIGFLFGIPRVLQEARKSEDSQANNQLENKSASYRMQVNTNLEQVSDWLTKIIVGVSLIELKNFPDYMNRAATFIGNGLDGGPNTHVFAGAMIIYFALLGFLSSYLLTRLYLTSAFKRADEAVVYIAGNELTIQEVNTQVGDYIADLQTQIVDIQQKMRTLDSRGSFELEFENGARHQSTSVRSILWVDDNPKNNSLLIDYLKRLKIDVVTVLSTDEAMARLKTNKYDRIISDLSRIEDGINLESAGIDLVRKVKRVHPDIPVVIYCTEPAAAAFRSAALGAGASHITPSQTELIEALKLYG
jgi:CheY-like chemotaxis protein